MKKTLMTFAVILGGLFVLLTVMDTSDYKLEKRLFYLQKKFATISKSPEATPDQVFDRLIREYEYVIRRFPDSKNTPKVYFLVGRVNILRKDYPRARESFQKVLELYPNNLELCAEALLNVAGIFEKEGEGSQSINTYKRIKEFYPLTDVGLKIPLYISRYYVKEGDQEKANQALREGARFYQKIGKDYPGSLLNFNASRLLASIYLSLDEWKMAVDTLGGILLEYANSEYLSPQRSGLIIKSINTVCAAQLKDYNVAIKVYQKFLEENPEHRLNKFLQGMIPTLEEMRMKSLSVPADVPDADAEVPSATP